MPSLTNLIAFAFVALGMVLTPGPNMIYLISRSIIQGRVAGLISHGGNALGFVVYMLCAAFGLTALVFAVAYTYDALRLTGARVSALARLGCVASRRTVAIVGEALSRRQPAPVFAMRLRKV